MESRVIDCEGGRMEPVSEWQNPKIEIVVASRRAMNDDRATKTVSILNRIM